MNASRRAVTFQEGRIRLDSVARTVITDGQLAKLGGRAFDLLEALIARRDRVVPKQELLDVVWPGLIVEENNLQVHVATLRKLFGPQSITTVQGRGYRFSLSPDLDRDNRVDNAAATSIPVATEDDAATPTTSLIGRDALVSDACARLRSDDVRLLTLTGVGGSGKTRVGLRVAAELAHSFADGSYVVMLAPIRDPAHVPAAIAIVLGVQEAGPKPTTELIASHLRDREMLLMLDNFEHVLGATPLLATLLAQCARLKLMVTSRTVLRTSGENVLVVPPLAVPARGATGKQTVNAPAVRQFLERARAAGREAGKDATDLAAVAEVCRRLDGLPLAIELAAARARVLTPRAMSERLGSRLGFLKAHADDVPARQRTLRDAMEWSHDLLDADGRLLFRRLAVFVGGWTLDAAEAVAGSDGLRESVLDALESLLNHSLVQRVDDVDGEARFGALETVREFAHEQLEASGETDEVRRRHAEYFTALATTAEPRLTSAQRRSWLMRLTAEYHNLRAALSWVVLERLDVELALRLVSTMPWVWYFAGQFSEGRGWIRIARTHLAEGRRDAVVAKLLSGAARLAMYSGDVNEAIDLAERSVAIWREIGDRRGLAFALAHQGIPLLVSRRRDEASTLLGESRDCFVALDDAWGIAFATTYAGIAFAYEAGTEDVAQPMLTEGRARFRALGDDWGVTTSSHYLGTIALRRADYVAARELTEEMLHSARDLGDNYRVSRNLHQLAEIAMAQGDVEEAGRHLAASLALNRDQGRIGDAAQQFRLLARLEAMQGRPAHVVRLYGSASLYDGKERTLPADDPKINEAALAAARSELGERRYESEWALGAAMSFDDAATWAIQLVPSSTLSA